MTPLQLAGALLLIAIGASFFVAAVELEFRAVVERLDRLEGRVLAIETELAGYD